MLTCDKQARSLPRNETRSYRSPSTTTTHTLTHIMVYL